MLDEEGMTEGGGGGEAYDALGRNLLHRATGRRRPTCMLFTSSHICGRPQYTSYIYLTIFYDSSLIIYNYILL